MPLEITGGCHCGAIRYAFSGEPVGAQHCQCADCRRLSGTGHTSALRVPAAGVRLTGEAKAYTTQGESGNRVERSFCPNCGAPVFSRNSGAPEILNLRASSLDDPERFRPSRVIYTESAPSWDVIDPALPRFPRMGPL